MPVYIHCSDCQHGLRVPSEMLGRRVKCPGCGTHFEAASSAVESTSPDVNDSVALLPDTSGNQMSNSNVVTECLTGATNQDGMIESKKDVPNQQPADAWFVMTHHSDCYGPVTRKELDQWMDESRIGADYHILQHDSPKHVEQQCGQRGYPYRRIGRSYYVTSILKIQWLAIDRFLFGIPAVCNVKNHYFGRFWILVSAGSYSDIVEQAARCQRL